jgi:rod shape-determining protein MreC
MSAGNRVVTWGSKNGRPYVPGVPIGVITAVRGTTGDLVRSAYIKPYVNFSTLDLVGIVVAGPRTNPRDGVLPKKLPTMAKPVRKCYFTVPNPNPNPSPSASTSFSPTPTIAPTPKLVCVWTVPTRTGAVATPTPKPKKS